MLVINSSEYENPTVACQPTYIRCHAAKSIKDLIKYYGHTTRDSEIAKKIIWNKSSDFTLIKMTVFVVEWYYTILFWQTVTIFSFVIGECV